MIFLQCWFVNSNINRYILVEYMQGKEILNKRIGGNMEAAAQMIFYVETVWKIHNMQIFGLPSYGYEYKWRAYLNVLLHYAGDKVKPVKVAQKPGRHFYALAPGSRIWMELDLQQLPLQAGHHRRLLWIQRLTLILNYNRRNNVWSLSSSLYHNHFHLCHHYKLHHHHHHHHVSCIL